MSKELKDMMLSCCIKKENEKQLKSCNTDRNSLLNRTHKYKTALVVDVSIELQTHMSLYEIVV